MKKVTLQKANDLNNDITKLSKIITEVKEKHHWIQVVTPDTKKYDYGFSVRFQNELTAWLENKKQQYQKEFDELN